MSHKNSCPSDTSAARAKNLVRVPTLQTLLQKRKVHREVAEYVVQQIIKGSGQNEQHEPFLSTPLQGDAVDQDAAAGVSAYTEKVSRDAHRSLAERDRKRG